MIGNPKTISSLMLKIIGTVEAYARPLLALFFENSNIAIRRHIVEPQPPISTKQSKKPLVRMLVGALPAAIAA